jgi:hypothetical protein
MHKMESLRLNDEDPSPYIGRYLSHGLGKDVMSTIALSTGDYSYLLGIELPDIVKTHQGL